MTYGGEIYFLFLARKFSENLQRKWASKTVSVIVERRIDSNFHGLYSYRPKKWRENVQNFAVKPLACGYIVVLLEVLNTDVILWLIRVQTMENIIVVDLSSRFWRVPHYMAEKPNQSCHTFVKYVSKGCKKHFGVAMAAQPSIKWSPSPTVAALHYRPYVPRFWQELLWATRVFRREIAYFTTGRRKTEENWRKQPSKLKSS